MINAPQISPQALQYNSSNRIHIMMTFPQNGFTRLLFLAAIAAPALIACSKQNWYQGMQSAHEAQCLKGPASEYDECMKQSGDSYNEYEKNREALSEDSAVKSK